MTTEREVDGLLASWLDSVRSPQPDGLLEDVLTATRSTRPRPAWRVQLSRNPVLDAPSGVNRMAPMALAATALVVAILVSIGLLARSPNVGPPPAPSPTDTVHAQMKWTGPVRATVGAPLLQSLVEAAPRAEGPSGPIPLVGWDERSPDAAVAWVDITGVRFAPGDLLTWYVDIGAYPPRTDSLDRNETLISYGLVVDANEDGVADYELGMSNDAPTPGDLRLWITDLSTGETDEHVGRPSGQPFEEWHPDARVSEDEGRQPRFTLPESDLPGVDGETVRFYAWSSVTEGPDVVGWDYAPDEGWLTVAGGSAGLEASSAPEASLPAMGLPGARPAPAGGYGWTGTLGASTGIHSVIEIPDSPDESRQTQLTFAVADDCFAYGTHAVPEPVTVAGLDGLYVESYDDPAVMFMPPPRGSAATGAYALAVEDRTLCVYLTWDPNTTQAELEAARQVVESLRAQPFGRDGIRITFDLPDGWDTG